MIAITAEQYNNLRTVFKMARKQITNSGVPDDAQQLITVLNLENDLFKNLEIPTTDGQAKEPGKEDNQ